MCIYLYLSICVTRYLCVYTSLSVSLCHWMFLFVYIYFAGYLYLYLSVCVIEYTSMSFSYFILSIITGYSHLFVIGYIYICLFVTRSLYLSICVIEYLFLSNHFLISVSVKHHWGSISICSRISLPVYLFPSICSLLSVYHSCPLVFLCLVFVY